MIFPPGSSPTAAGWAAEFGGHMAVGLVLCAVAALVVPSLWRAALVAAVAYGALWEGLWQRLGAGLPDAALDTFAVACGAIIGAAAWRHKGPVIAGTIAAATAVLVAGIRRRL